MAIIQCRECRKDASDSAKTCPHCGTRTPSSREYWITNIARLVAATLVMGALFSEPSRAYFSTLLNKTAPQNCEVADITFSHETFMVNGEADYGIKAFIDLRNKSTQSLSGTLNVRLETSEGDFTREGKIALEPNAARRIEIDFHEPTLGVKDVVGRASCVS